jgi:CheB methylesterase
MNGIAEFRPAHLAPPADHCGAAGSCTAAIFVDLPLARIPSPTPGPAKLRRSTCLRLSRGMRPRLRPAYLCRSAQPSHVLGGFSHSAEPRAESPPHPNRSRYCCPPRRCSGSVFWASTQVGGDNGGAAGAPAITQHGGIAFVQETKAATTPSMPRAAIMTIILKPACRSRTSRRMCAYIVPVTGSFS